MKILVTGGAGYIGSVLVPVLLYIGHEVTVIDNFFYKQNSLLDVCYHPNFHVIIGDVRDEAFMKNHINKHDVIIPLAAIVGAPACNKDKQLAKEVNYEAIKIIGTVASSDQMVLFPTTNSGYGIGQSGVYCDEATPLKPISLYGQTKADAEKMLLEYGGAITFRLATVFGTSPRMRLDLLLNDFVYKALTDRFIVLFESHFKRNYIHIRDVASAFLFGIKHYEKMKGEPFNLGLSDANLSKMELCMKIKQHLPDFHIFESDIGEDPDKRDYIVSNAKIESLGFRPQYSLDMGIKELIRAYSMLNLHNFKNV
jgi:nucleoside-diphosphate-sugar epimerase